MSDHNCVIAYDAATCDFPIQNLPYGVFSTEGSEPRVGVAIGDKILDLAAVAAAGHFGSCATLAPHAADVFAQSTLNAFMALGKDAWDEARATMTTLLTAGGEGALSADDAVFVGMADATMHMPVACGDYTDMYCAYSHAFKVGSMIRGPENAIKPNWKEMPIGYHGRASTVLLSPQDIVRPWGQASNPTAGEEHASVFGVEKALDFELEMGIIVGKGNEMGKPIRVKDADQHLFGLVLLNDASARKAQVFEYAPLGPFRGKNFCTTISPWVVTFAALEPFKVPAMEKSPTPHAYLIDPDNTTYDIKLEAAIATPDHPEDMVISQPNFTDLYWSTRQMLAAHSTTGCAMASGDIIGTGTISGPERNQSGCMLEISERGSNPLTLPSGEERTYLKDGDTIVLRGHCQGDGYRIGFGETRDTVLPALPAEYWE